MDHADVLTGRLGGSKLYLLSGDGQGGFLEQRLIALPGSLTALKTGELDTPDGRDEVLAALDGDDGPQLVIFASPYGSLSAAKPTILRLPAPVNGLALGLFDGDERLDAVAVAGNHLLLVHGRGRMVTGETGELPVLDSRKLPFQALAVAAGNFSGHAPELAILSAEGQLFLARYTSPAPLSKPHGASITQAAADGVPAFKSATLTRPLPTPELPLAEWVLRAVAPAPSLPAGGRLVIVRAAAGRDALAVLPSLGTASGNAPGNNGQMLVINSAADGDQRIQAETVSDLPALAAALSMRLTPDARQGLVALQAGLAGLQVYLPDTGSSFTVNLASDQADADLSDDLCDVDESTAGDQCTLRAAILQANATRLVATINFNIGSGLQKIAPASQLPQARVALTLDATTQPGYVGTPLIQLSGEAAAGASGLSIHDGSLVRGLVIGNFGLNGLIIDGAGGGNIVEGNYIGTDPSGTSARPKRQPGRRPLVIPCRGGV